MTKEESLRLEKILKKIDEADETNCKKEEEYNEFCANIREDWNEEQYQKLKREKTSQRQHTLQASLSSRQK